MYPVGHPQIIVNPESQNIEDYFGIAKFDVLAPEKLLHPVLSVKLNGKVDVLLMYKVCRGTIGTSLVSTDQYV